MRRGGAKQRRDSSEAAIISDLRKLGAFVVQCHGDGAPDLIVYWRSQWLPVEVKAPGGRVRARQRQYPIAHTTDEVLALFGGKP